MSVYVYTTVVPHNTIILLFKSRTLFFGTCWKIQSPKGFSSSRAPSIAPINWNEIAQRRWVVDPTDTSVIRFYISQYLFKFNLFCKIPDLNLFWKSFLSNSPPPTCWKSPLEVRTFRFPFSFHLIGGGDVLSDYNWTGLGIEIANTSCSNVGYMLWFIHGILLWMKKDGSLEMFVFFNFFPKFFFAYCRYMIYLYIYIRHRWTFEYTVYIRDQFFFASGRRARRFDIRQVDVVLNWWFFQSLLDVDGGGSQNSMDIKPSGHGVFNFLLPRISAKKDVKFATSDSTPNCFFQLRNLTWGLCPRADGVSHFQEGYCSSQILGYQALRLLGGCFFS